MTAEDSVEAFLAREQEQLAGIDDEFGTLTTNENNTGGVNGLEQEQSGGESELAEVKTPAVEEKALVNGSHQETPPSGENTPISISSLPLQQQTAMRRLATPTPPPTRDEPTKIKAWREKQKERLAKKDEQEENEKKKLREQAKRELEEWYQKRNEQLEKTMKHNRTLEQEFANQRDSVEPGQEWERVARLCDFNSKNASRGTKDMSRFRSILLQMKNNPPKQQVGTK